MPASPRESKTASWTCVADATGDVVAEYTINDREVTGSSCAAMLTIEEQWSWMATGEWLDFALPFASGKLNANTLPPRHQKSWSLSHYSDIFLVSAIRGSHCYEVSSSATLLMLQSSTVDPALLLHPHHFFLLYLFHH